MVLRMVKPKVQRIGCAEGFTDSARDDPGLAVAADALCRPVMRSTCRGKGRSTKD